MDLNVALWNGGYAAVHVEGTDTLADVYGKVRTAAEAEEGAFQLWHDGKVLPEDGARLICDTPVTAASKVSASWSPAVRCNLTKKEGGRLLWQACMSNNVPDAHRALTAGVDANIKWCHAFPVGRVLCCTAHPMLLRSIMEREEGMSRYRFDERPLHEVLSRGYTALARLLVAAGADVNAEGTRRKKPLDCTGDAETVRWLLECGANPSAARLQAAAVKGEMQVLRSLIAAGADVDALHSERTPLTAAVTSSFLEPEAGTYCVVQLLIDSGADVNRADGGGFTPLHHADEIQFPRVCDLLRGNGANMK